VYAEVTRLNGVPVHGLHLQPLLIQVLTRLLVFLHHSRLRLIMHHIRRRLARIIIHMDQDFTLPSCSILTCLDTCRLILVI